MTDRVEPPGDLVHDADLRNERREAPGDARFGGPGLRV